MTQKLPINLTANKNEPGFSLLARLASANTGRTTIEFCRSTGLIKREICAGKADALGKLAVLTGSNQTALLDDSPLVMGRKLTILSGLKIQSRSVRKQDLSICPACWLQQLETGQSKPYALSMHVHWLPRQLHTCQTHSVKLVPLPYENYTNIYDHVRRSHAEIGWIGRLAAYIEHQNYSNFESALADHLKSKTPMCTWLPKEQVDTLERWCLGLGLLIERGSDGARGLAAGEEANLIDVGFEVMLGGKDQMHREVDAALRKHRLRLTATWLATWAYQHPKPPERQGLARLLKSLCDDQGYFCLQSTSTADPKLVALEMGLNRIAKSSGKTPSAVRQILTTDGYLPANGVPHQNDMRAFLRTCAAQIRAIDNSLPIRKSADILGVGVQLFKGLVEDRIFVPLRTRTYKKARFEHDHLDSFLGEIDELIGDRPPCADQNMQTIQAGCFHLTCSAGQILALLRANQLQSACYGSSGHGLGRVRIDIEELKSKLLQQDGSGLSLEDLRKLLGLERRFAAKLSAVGLLPSYSGRKSSTGGRASLVAPCVYDHFVEHYHTVRTWAARAMITESQVRIALKVNNIRPAPEADGVPVYRIEDLRRL